MSEGEGRKVLCHECGKAMHVGVADYLYEESGLQVVLLDLEMLRCDPCEIERPVIPNITGLHLTIGLLVVQKASPLLPEEVRFLRKTLGLSISDLASLLGVVRSAVSEWESDKKKMSAANDRHIRRTYVLALLERDDRELVHINQINAAIARVRRDAVESTAHVELRYSQGVARFSGGTPMPPAWLVHELDGPRDGSFNGNSDY